MGWLCHLEWQRQSEHKVIPKYEFFYAMARLCHLGWHRQSEHKVVPKYKF